MACLRKKGNRYYVKDYVDGKEKWFKTETTVKRVAEEFLRRYESAKACGTPSPFPSKTPLPEMLTAFCAYLKGTSRKNNYTKDLSRLRLIFGPACPELDNGRNGDDAARTDQIPPRISVANLEEITTADVTDFLDKLAERGLATSTVNNYREILVRFANWAITQKGKRFPGGKNPVEAVAIRAGGTLEITYLSPERIVQQLEALRRAPAFQQMVAVLIYAGLRRKELLWLRKRDIVRDHAGDLKILVRAKTVDGIFWRPKNKKNRSVPVSLSLRPYLEAALLNSTDDVWLFPSPMGKRWDPDNFSSDLRDVNTEAAAAIAASDMDPMPVWSCLDYRHTFGSLLATKGISLYIIAELMGNSPDVCRKHYAHLMPSALSGAIDFLVPGGATNSTSLMADAFGRMIPDPPLPAERAAAVSDQGDDRRQVVQSDKPRPGLRLVVNKR